MSLFLCSLVRSTVVPVVTRFSTSETKPWLLLFLVFLLDVSLVIVELVLDIGLVIVLEGTKTLGIVRCFVSCVDLPEKKKKQLFFTLIFCFLRARASAAFNFFFSFSLSLAKSSDRLNCAPPYRRFVRYFYKFVSFLEIFYHILNCLSNTTY